MLFQKTVSTGARSQLLDISGLVETTVRESGVQQGLAVVYCPHTTAGITINENADPSVTSDIVSKLSRLLPQNDGYAHGEGNSDAHIKSSLVGASETLIIDKGRLVLGTWQGIYFCEFDGPRKRTVFIKITG
jgi:secondary thiamine-phosphate synthase enzyme